MNRTKIGFGTVVAVWGLCVCCSAPVEKRPIERIVAVDREKPRMADSVMASRFTNGRYVFLRGVMLGRIDRLLDWGDRLVVFDRQQQQVAIFDTTGNCKASIRRLGKGPGEYIQAGDCAIDLRKNELVLYADQPGKLLFFNKEGKYLREERLPDCFFEMSCLGDYLYGVNCGHDRRAGYTVSILPLAKSDEKTESLTDDPNPFSISAGKQLVLSGSSLRLSRPFDNAVYRFDTVEREFVPEFRFDFGSGNMSEDYLRGKTINTIFSDAHRDGVVLHVGDVCSVGSYLFFKAPTSYMLDMATDSVERLGFLALPEGVVAAGAPSSYVPFEYQDRCWATVILPESLIRWTEDMANGVMMWDPKIEDLARRNSEFQNPVLVFYDVY